MFYFTSDRSLTDGRHTDADASSRVQAGALNDTFAAKTADCVVAVTVDAGSLFTLINV